MPDVDIVAALRYPSTDPDWTRKCLLHGLFGLVPLIGPFALFGWQRRIFDGILAGGGETLPEPALMEEVRDGVPPVLAAMNLAVFALPMVFVALGVSLYTQSMFDPGSEEELNRMIGSMVFLVLGMQVVAVLVALLGQLTLPELLRRGFGGETLPLFHPADSLARARRAPMALALTIFGMLAANIIGSLGFYLCFVGGFLTVPYAGAAIAHLIAQWHRASGAPG